MRYHRTIPAWKSAPFCRLLMPLITGILLQWYLPLKAELIIGMAAIALILFIAFYFLSLSFRFRFRALQGGLLYFLLLAITMLLCRQQAITAHPRWYGHYVNDSSSLLISIAEPPVEKAKSFKAEANVYAVVNGSAYKKTRGKLIIYLSKNDSASLHYGDRLLIHKKLQFIKNSGNPGAFDYRQYAAFQGIFHTVFLQKNDYLLQPGNDIGLWDQFIFDSRAAIVKALKKFIPGDNRIAGIAEALLIGYKQDLDRDLVQAYSNAGVVHIIAISGMHLGLIYIVLVWIFARIPVIKKSKLATVVMILSCLWLFSILTGSSASVLRSAVMFTCIVIGKNFFKQSSAYNSLAASAFILLCYNPYFLWDVGFQLSYLAVFGIMWLQQPIYRRFYFKNKWLNTIWGMISVTLAAQIVTFPICIYYFHQFPNLFLLTNLVAVPLSTVILFVEIFILVFAWLPWLAAVAGKLAAMLIALMNWLIESCNNIPFAMIEMIYATAATTLILYVVVFALSAWIMYQKRNWLRIAMISAVLFIVLQAIHIFKVQGRRELIVYNINKHTAFDYVYQKKFLPVMDSALIRDASLQAFNLRPARISLQLQYLTASMNTLSTKGLFTQFGSKQIMVIDSAIAFSSLTKKIPVDMLLITGNPTLDLDKILSAIQPSIIVFDASNALWKIEKWKKACEQLLLRCYSVAEQGAFVLDCN